MKRINCFIPFMNAEQKEPPAGDPCIECGYFSGRP